MRINNFAEKYGVDKRTIDYWTTIGLLHPDVDANNGYRDYDKKTEEEIKTIIIAVAMNMNASLQETVDMIQHIPKGCWHKIVVEQILEERRKSARFYDDALEFARSNMGD